MTTVLAHGVFDLLHPGHITHLEQAKAMGDKLIVSITSAQYVRKGPDRPVFSDAERVALLASLRCVDDVYICHASSALPAIQKYKPDIYAKGPDYSARSDGTFAEEQATVEALGGEVRFTTGDTASSSQLINTYVAEHDKALTNIRKRFSYEDITDYLDRAGELTGHCFGEAIKDQYIYVKPAWKSAKELLIDYVEEGPKTFHGGIHAVHNHLLALCPNSRVFASRPITKRRYVDNAFGQKLFSVARSSQVSAIKELPHGDFDLVVDYGHGAFNPTNTLELCSGNYLALNVQANGLNWGFNRLQKWPRANYVVVDEPELRLAAGNRDSKVEDLVWLFQYMGWEYMAVTLGHQGCMVFHRDGQSFRLPVLLNQVVDRIGAGDAFLAVTAPLAYLKAPIEIIALVGNVAGGLQVANVGNSESITRSNLNRVLKSILA